MHGCDAAQHHKIYIYKFLCLELSKSFCIFHIHTYLVFACALSHPHDIKQQGVHSNSSQFQQRNKHETFFFYGLLQPTYIDGFLFASPLFGSVCFYVCELQHFCVCVDWMWSPQNFYLSLFLWCFLRRNSSSFRSVCIFFLHFATVSACDSMDIEIFWCFVFSHLYSIPWFVSSSIPFILWLCFSAIAFLVGRCCVKTSHRHSLRNSTKDIKWTLCLYVCVSPCAMRSWHVYLKLH